MSEVDLGKSGFQLWAEAHRQTTAPVDDTDWSEGTAPPPGTPGSVVQHIPIIRDPRVNYNLLPDDVLLQCPYVPSHTVLEKRITIHLNKCMRNYNNARKTNPHLPPFSWCQYNWKHHMLSSKLAEHELTCPDKPDDLPDWKSTGPIVPAVGEGGNAVAVASGGSGGDDDEENWEKQANENPAPSFDYIQNLQHIDKAIFHIPGGMAPKERKEWCAKQCMLYAKNKEKELREAEVRAVEQAELWRACGYSADAPEVDPDEAEAPPQREWDVDWDEDKKVERTGSAAPISMAEHGRQWQRRGGYGAQQDYPDPQ